MPYAVPTSSGASYARPQPQQSPAPDEKGSEASASNNSNKANTATRRKASAASKEDDKEASKKKQRTREKSTEDDEKRKNFLERNRIGKACTLLIIHNYGNVFIDILYLLLW